MGPPPETLLIISGPRSFSVLSPYTPNAPIALNYYHYLLNAFNVLGTLAGTEKKGIIPAQGFFYRNCTDIISA